MARGPRSHDILRHLRRDSRKSLAAIAREEGLAVSTVFEHVRQLDRTFVDRHTSLLEHAKLGYPFRTVMYCTHPEPDRLAGTLKEHDNANNVFILKGSGVAADMIFRTLQEEEECKETLHAEGCTEVRVHRVLEPLLEEGWIPGQKEDLNASDTSHNGSENSP